jgi:transposase-like protein
MTTRDIVATFKEMYDTDVSPTLISPVTNAVIEQAVQWQARPLDTVYPIDYLDYLVVKIRQDKQVINKGDPDAVNTVYSEAQIQFCIVHMVRNSLRFMPGWTTKPSRLI